MQINLQDAQNLYKNWSIAKKYHKISYQNLQISKKNSNFAAESCKGHEK